ncbi:MAG: efflux RND transporter periplasmic adaptor subunit [Gracilimonas sp.]|uniref:efflux RND transporter periplasmic adaptor subunit n=1 Tax=Gracilimonas TaxID=649462 RepID=UPI001B13A18D|nr:efflux RND transporter periplasmic adaptor subunit [Gracilimonas sp.]MBO6586820.1 efflux RND transporter periplasmic adaptor subunit [Gracilimonas sp.]MBO6614692.1 efflux RND transporter periplasmic adaptor subunit [Gracilimonas sp.]
MKTKNILIYSALILGGLLLGYLFFGGSSEPQTLEEHISETHTNEEGEIVYTCSMHPQIRENEPGNCPICGMELIPAGDSESGALENEYTLTMTNAAVKLAEIQTSLVEYGDAVHTFTLPGKVVENQNNVSSVTAHFPGRIRDLYVDYEGTFVQEGQKMASVYSPQLIAAQQELLETVKYKEQNPRLYEAAKQKLRLWEFPESTINAIERSGEIMTELDFFSPVSGYVSEVAISREEHVMEGGLMYRVVNLSSVWVDFQAFESNVANIEEGDNVQFSVEAFPGQQFEAEVIYVDPFLNNDSRSVTIRTRIENPRSMLKPGMLARANIRSEVSEGEALLVPRSAVMWTGKRSIVYVQVRGTDTPTFEAREVEIGQRAGEYYVVESGLQQGELVVTNGTFKIDSAAQLNDKLSMMNREPGAGANRSAHDHGGMEMDISGDSEDMDHTEHQTMQLMSADSDTTHKSVHQHSTHLDKLVENYLKMKTALTQDNLDQALIHFQAFAKEVRTSSEMNKHEEHAQKHAVHHHAMLEAVSKAEKASDIKSFRSAFKKISAELITALENQGYEGSLFKQYCPMYEVGSSWISDSEEIKNPFYGSRMHNCGETVEQL